MAYVNVNGKLVKKSKGQFRGNGFKLPMGVLDYATEFAKSVKMVTEDLIPYDTKMTKNDFNLGGFGNAGFLMALVPYSGTGVVAKTNDVAKVKSVLAKVHTEKVGNKWVLLRTHIGRDITYDLFSELHDTFHTAFIVYSTPEHIATLSEDRDLCMALRDHKDPITALEIL